MKRSMPWIFIGVLGLILIPFSIPTSLAASDLPSRASGKLLFLTSSDAPGAVDRERLKACMQQMAQEMEVVDKEMPLVMVAHVSRSAGKTLGVKQTTVRRNSGPGGDVYYELWLVGPVELVEYVKGMEAVLELHFGLRYTQSERTRVMTRVLRCMHATVSVKAYRE